MKEHRTLGAKRGWMRREMEFRRVIIEREMSMAGQLSPLLSSSFPSIARLFPPFSTPFLFVRHPFYSRKWICFPRAKRLVLLFRPRPSEWDDQILLCCRWPVQTMTPWKVSLHSKQDEKYLAWFFRPSAIPPISWLNAPEKLRSWTCTQLVGEMTRHHIERTFLSEDSWKLWYTLSVRTAANRQQAGIFKKLFHVKQILLNIRLIFSYMKIISASHVYL